MSELHLEQVSLHANFIKSLIESGLNHFVGIGTCMEYGINSGCLSEDVKPKPPILPYGVGKNSVRDLIAESCNINDTHFQWLRLFYLVGEGLQAGSLFSQLKRALDAGDKSIPMSEGKQVRDFLDVKTIAEMIILPAFC